MAVGVDCIQSTSVPASYFTVEPRAIFRLNGSRWGCSDDVIKRSDQSMRSTAEIVAEGQHGGRSSDLAFSNKVVGKVWAKAETTGSQAFEGIAPIVVAVMRRFSEAVMNSNLSF